MDKQEIIGSADALASAAQQAQDWVSRNEDRVRACGKTKDAVLADLRQQARILRKLGEAAGRKMCAGVFGPSQAGKSYLLSSLARDESNNALPCDFGGKSLDFLKEINPGGGKESTGLVTRFTMSGSPHISASHPVHVRLLSETELVKIFANSYFLDCEHKEKVDKAAIENEVNELKALANSSCLHITIDEMEDLQTYVSNSFAGSNRAAALDEAYWNTAVKIGPKLAKKDRIKLYSIIWDGVEEFTDLLSSLIDDLEKLNHPKEAFCTLDSLVPREASIIDVDTLGKSDFAEFHATPSVEVKNASGATASISRKNLTAIVAELVLTMIHKPADYFNHTDLLDFPGYKARLECNDIREYLHSGKKDGTVEQFFRRGKVAYLFQRYIAERDLTSLLLCVAEPTNVPGLPGAVESWIEATHGVTPEERAQLQNSLFYILTKADRYFQKSAGQNLDQVWDATLKGSFLGHFGSTHSHRTHWVDQWTPNHPFNNLFMLRNVNITWGDMLECKDGKEMGFRADMAEHKENMKRAFLASSLVNRHFASPSIAYDELMKLNDGGIEHIKRSLAPMCDPLLKLRQIEGQLIGAREKLLSTICPFFQSGDKEEELKKKTVLFKNLYKLICNAKCREHFPELLNSFSQPLDKLFYMYREAAERYETYRETSSKRQESIAQAMVEDLGSNKSDALNDLDDAGLPDLDDFFAEPEPQTEPPSSQQVAGAAGGEEEKTELYFFAECIVEAWSEGMRKKAEDPNLKDYYGLPAQIYLGIIDELDAGAQRLGIQKQILSKFMEIDRHLDGDKDSKTRKQVSYAMGILSDFVCWMGKNPSTCAESQRKVQYNGQDRTVFKDRPAIIGCPQLPDQPQKLNGWFSDWLMTFYGLMEDNAISDQGIKINIEENSRLGKIINSIQGN